MQSECWAVKYRPRSLNEVCGNTETLRRLQELVQPDNNSTEPLYRASVILHGPAFTGKTLVANLMAQSIVSTYRDSRDRILHVRASDDRGIQHLRDRLCHFRARKMTGTRVAVFEAAESLTDGVQQVLRSIMEPRAGNGKNDAFAPSDSIFMCIFVCRQLHTVISAIKSHCVQFAFEKLREAEVLAFLRDVCAREQQAAGTRDSGSSSIIPDATVVRVARACDGDAMRALGILEYCSIAGPEIPCAELFFELEHMGALARALLTADSTTAFRTVALLRSLGHTNSDILDQFMRFVRSFAIVDENTAGTEQDTTTELFVHTSRRAYSILLTQAAMALRRSKELEASDVQTAGFIAKTLAFLAQ